MWNLFSYLWKYLQKIFDYSMRIVRFLNKRFIFKFLFYFRISMPLILRVYISSAYNLKWSSSFRYREIYRNFNSIFKTEYRRHMNTIKYAEVFSYQFCFTNCKFELDIVY